jgi:hypothetical protein
MNPAPAADVACPTRSRSSSRTSPAPSITRCSAAAAPKMPPPTTITSALSSVPLDRWRELSTEPESASHQHIIRSGSMYISRLAELANELELARVPDYPSDLWYSDIRIYAVGLSASSSRHGLRQGRYFSRARPGRCCVPHRCLGRKRQRPFSVPQGCAEAATARSRRAVRFSCPARL